LNRAGAERVGGANGLPVADWVLAIGFEDNVASVAWQVDQIRSELAPAEVDVREGADAEPLWSALTEFPAAEAGFGPVSFTASLRLSAVVAFVKDLDPARWAIQAHAGNGIVRGHALGGIDRDSLGTELDRLRKQADRDGGSLILPRCPTDWKAALHVWGTPRPDWALAERVKHAFDPKGVMNPGRFVGTI
jgi:glycolate oxidase FAD binding subunit